MTLYPNIYRTLAPGPMVELRGYASACGLPGRLYACLDYGGPTGTARDGLAEGMLALQSSSDSKKDPTREQIDGLKNDIRSIEEAIAGYKERVAQLEATNGRQSAEFKKLAAGLRAQLEESQARVAELEAKVAEQERELGVKTREIAELNENVAGLEAESSEQKERIASQDRSLHEGHYLVGSRRELREAGVISAGDMTTEAAVTKLMWALAQAKDVEAIRDLMLQNICGEITQ